MKIKTIRLRTRHRRKSRATSLWNILTGKWGKQHRLPAHVTGEGDWEVEVPQIRMSRAFAVMLVLHIVAVGGLFAFRIWGRDDTTETGITNTGTGPAVSLVSAPKADEAGAADLPSEPLKTYTWHAGDTLQLVAARFNISGSALRDANPGKELVPGAEIVVPRSGRIIGGAEVGTPAGQAAAIYDPLAPETKEVASTSPPPKPEVLPELDGKAGIPDVIPPPAEETPRPVVQKVVAPITAKPTGKTGLAKVEMAVARPASKPEPVITKTIPKAEVVTTKPPRAEVVTTKSKTTEHAQAKAKPKTAEKEDQPARSGGQRVHVVTKGDTVFNVAKRFGFTAAEIAKANGLGSDYRIQLGQQLRIPVRR